MQTAHGFLVPEYYHLPILQQPLLILWVTNFVRLIFPLPCSVLLVAAFFSLLPFMITLSLTFFSSVFPTSSFPLKTRSGDSSTPQYVLSYVIWSQGQNPFLITVGQSPRWLSWLSKDYPSQAPPPAGQWEQQLWQDLKSCRVPEMVVYQRAQHQPDYIAVNPIKEIGRPGLSCIKPSWLFRRAAPETGIFILSQKEERPLHSSSAASQWCCRHSRLTRLPTFVFFPWCLLSSSFFAKPGACVLQWPYRSQAGPWKAADQQPFCNTSAKPNLQRNTSTSAASKSATSE